jgi:CAAX prenyl protease-like protein
VGGFHSQAGWLAFNAVALGLVVVSRRSRLFARAAAGDEAQTQTHPEPRPVAAVVIVSPTLAYLGPLLVLVATVMVTAALSPGTGLDLLYPARVVTVAAALVAWRKGYAGLKWSWSWLAVALGVAVFAVWMLLEPTHAAPASTEMRDGLSKLPRALAALWLILRVIGSVVTVPIAEELAFRGYLSRRLIAPDFTTVAPGKFTWVSLLVSSAVFGALHGRWLAGTLAGMLYAASYSRKGDLAEPVLAHATTNALIAAYVLATGAWSLWA